MVNNPGRGRFNAWLLDVLDGYMHEKYCEVKTRLLGGAPAVVVELGPGSGANLRYYQRGTRVIAIEPNVRMHERLRRRAGALGLELDLRTLGGEGLDLANASVDFVCATLVLCSVEDPAGVMAEVRRVLRPGGRFVCIEHVAAPPSSAIYGLQRAIRRPWRWVFEGCNLSNETASVIRAAGFRTVVIEPLTVPTVFLPIRHQIAAICTA